MSGAFASNLAVNGNVLVNDTTVSLIGNMQRESGRALKCCTMSRGDTGSSKTINRPAAQKWLRSDRV
jgi:hypothetical protein